MNSTIFTSVFKYLYIYNSQPKNQISLHLEKDKLTGEMNRTLQDSEQCEQAQLASQEPDHVEDPNKNEEEEVRFAGLAELANYKYCLQCQTSQLLGSQ